ncbi:MAG: SurA N-terminal domain-containing protein [Alphaproteobacteria bacterium]|nr:SurA N-terminal domain-containing protein [Alphaproteobacteria bacterium]
MLELIRKYSKSIVVKIFLTILAGSFFLFFGFSYVVNKLAGKDYVVKIADVKIHPQVFKYEKNKKLNAVKRRYGEVDDKELSNTILRQIIWENVINLAAKDFGIIVSDSSVFNHISNMDEFRTKDGHFSAANLRRFLQIVGMTEEEFLQAEKREIKSQIIKFPFRYVSLRDEFAYYSKIATEKRSLKFFEINPASFTITERPTDEELTEFYNNNSEEFEVPEKRSFDVLILSMDRVEKNTEISQEEIIERARDIYGDDYTEKNLEEFMKTEEFKNFKQERVAEAAEEITRQVQDDLVSGSMIEEITTKYGLRSLNVKSVKLDEVDEIPLPFKKDVMTVAFGSDENEVGDFNEAEDSNKKLVQWLVYVSDVTPKHVEPLEQAKERVKVEWRKDRQHNKALAVANEVISKVSEGEKFADLVRARNYRLKSTSHFDSLGIVSDNSEKSEIIDSLHEEVFSKLKNEVGMKELNGKIVVFQVADISYDKKKEEENWQRSFVSLLLNYSDDMYQQLIGHLSKKYEVKINYDILKEVDESIDPSALDEVF